MFTSIKSFNEISLSVLETNNMAGKPLMQGRCSAEAETQQGHGRNNLWPLSGIVTARRSDSAEQQPIRLKQWTSLLWPSREEMWLKTRHLCSELLLWRLFSTSCMPGTSCERSVNWLMTPQTKKIAASRSVDRRRRRWEERLHILFVPDIFGSWGTFQREFLKSSYYRRLWALKRCQFSGADSKATPPEPTTTISTQLVPQLQIVSIPDQSGVSSSNVCVWLLKHLHVCERNSDVVK